MQKLLDDIFNNLKTLEKLPSHTNNELSRLDKEQCDVLHMIEFGKFNACEGYKFAKRLQDIRIERRNIKNMQDTMRKYKPTMDKYRSVMQSLESCKNINEEQVNKTYRARVMDKKDDLAKLKSVNKTDIKFRNNRYESKMESLFEQIESK